MKTLKDRAKVMSRGQVTIPVALRRALDIEEGDEIVFRLRPDDDELHLKVRKKKTLSELAGVFQSDKPVPSKEKVRDLIGKELGARMQQERG